MQNIGIQAIITLAAYFIFTGVAFWALQAVRFDHLLRPGHVPQAQALFIILAAVLGYLCTSFFLNFIDNTRNLIFLLR
ncbi:DUF1146 family protein [Loigolactobacillus zhaoyuanensis]|uniref:DUF1146 family protein n=1 Tax=Loigolactobacillus zhaoyuanensis TaxID=2486017 RepID=A0ABW8UDH1_9LACO|nr:DUF1146 family protein [Loigolactobacillus zhaoyuanensis]